MIFPRFLDVEKSSEFNLPMDISTEGLILTRFRSFYAMKNMQMFQQIVINLEDMKLG